LLPMRLLRLLVQDQPPYTIKIDAAGRAMITIAGRTPEVHDLSIQQRDTVRLLLARLVETPVVSCTSPVHYQLQIDTGPNIPGPNIPGPKSPGPEISGPDCGFPQRQPEFHALTVLLENAFGV
jgi:hypothetical protein